MSTSKSFERGLLHSAEAYICSQIQLNTDYEKNRRLLIGAVAARIGGIDFSDLERLLESDVSSTELVSVWEKSSDLFTILCELPIPTPLAISSMLQQNHPNIERKRSGSYMTDYRLTMFLMNRLAKKLTPDSKVIDLSIGAGAFLIAFIISAKQVWKMPINEFILDCLNGFDLSGEAINNSLCALASLGIDIQILEKLKQKLIVTDSLLHDFSNHEVTTQGFDAIIGNPPWEKLKISRHEYLIGKGVERSYGDIYRIGEENLLIQNEYLQQRHDIKNYIKALDEVYFSRRKGDVDLYIYFLELAFRLVKPNGGFISMLVPAGLIRAEGTEILRKTIIDLAQEFEVTIFNNHKRYFEIDTRFKFLALELKTGNVNGSKFLLNIGDSDKATSFLKYSTSIDIHELNENKHKLTIIPEVRNQTEWDLFKHVISGNQRFGTEESIWYPHIVREIDMTRDRNNFSRSRIEGFLPLIEGRMIHQFNHSAKAYIDGYGRRATWKPRHDAECVFQPQFFYPFEALSKSIQERVNELRVGFCDISGQTNERTFIAAPIPKNTICGNKVPTLTFYTSEEWVPWAFLGLCNSFLIDWFMRRIVTTSLNYFIVEEIPLPDPSKWAKQLKKIAGLTKILACSKHFGDHIGAQIDESEKAEIRAEIEWRVLETYNLNASVLQMIFNDFPLLDRSEPSIHSEKHSTITKDLVSLHAMENLGGNLFASNRLVTTQMLRDRITLSAEKGALAFRPSHLSA